jgi:hypothetical protein
LSWSAVGNRKATADRLEVGRDNEAEDKARRAMDKIVGKTHRPHKK